ncbi:MAG: hypothetical protein Q8P01_04060 [bacterium]|nr:hypothetical protein [bacterium]
MVSFLSTIILFTLPGIVLVFLLCTVILEHHWRKYSIGARVLSRLRRVYYPVSAVFFLLSVVSFMLYFLKT